MRQNKKTEEKDGVKTGDIITGNKMLRFKIERAMSEANMAELFGLSPGKIKSILSSGEAGVDDPVVCYLYRQYEMYPELTSGDISLIDMYMAIGGKDAVRGSDFALTLGRELSAYIRHFRSGRPAPSLRTVIRNAMNLSEKDPVKAFEHIQNLFRMESASRGFDPLETRTWRNKGKLVKPQKTGLPKKTTKPKTTKPKTTKPLPKKTTKPKPAAKKKTARVRKVLKDI